MDMQKIMNLANQMKMSNNPMMSIMGMLNPQQQSQLNNFKSKPNNEQCQEVANVCNKNGITKSQLQEILNAFK